MHACEHSIKFDSNIYVFDKDVEANMSGEQIKIVLRFDRLSPKLNIAL